MSAVDAPFLNRCAVFEYDVISVDETVRCGDRWLQSRVGGSSGSAAGLQSEGPAVPSVSERPQRDGTIQEGFRRISKCV